MDGWMDVVHVPLFYAALMIIMTLDYSTCSLITHTQSSCLIVCSSCSLLFLLVSTRFFVLVSGEAHVSTPKQDLSLSHVPSDPPNTAIDTDLDLNLDLNLDIDIDNDTESATRNLYITSTRNSVILALDTDLRASGHLTFYPGRTETVALQIPLSSSLHLFDTPDGSGKRPLAVSGINYEVVKNGPCE